MSDIDPAVYRKAADVIRKSGLEKNNYGDMNTDRVPHCTIGALRYATGQPWVSFSILGPLADLLGPQPCPCGNANCGICEDPFSAITRWNDHPQRTPDDVLLLLEQAAEKLEADR